MIGNIGMSELLLIFIVVLLVFGAKRIPEIARGLGKGIREFKDATREIQRDLALEDRIHIPPSAPREYTTPQYSAVSQQPVVAQPVAEPAPVGATTQPVDTTSQPNS